MGSSPACANQGFLYRENVLGLQFHPEITSQALAGLLRNCGDELAMTGTEKGRFVQPETAIESGLAHAEALNAMMASACERLENQAACT